jgi:SAM-dependent methyltransferase
LISRFKRLLSEILLGALQAVSGCRVIVDRHIKLNYPVEKAPAIDTSINKEELSRSILFDAGTPSGLFFEIGSGDAELTYLLGIRGNFNYDAAFHQQNLAIFRNKFEYHGLDLAVVPAKNVVAGDICSPDFIDRNAHLAGKCSVVYSNNVFEHLRRPWLAAENVRRLLIEGGVCITVVPFSQRYHESPGDYFRYTHAGISSLFEDVMKVEIIRAGYDILGRRTDWQGRGLANDSVPTDEFGAWRETWFTFLSFRKLGERDREEVKSC